MRICSRCKALLAPDARACGADGAPFEDVDQLPLGSKIGAYKIEKLLGEGGMGFVYEATHEVLGRRTAIKFLRPELAGHPQIVLRFLQEAKAVNLINHANIINVYDYGDGADGSVYFVMEYLDGETLDDLMKKRRPMPAPLLLHVFGQIAKALAAAHAKKIVHRDLKPVNVYVIAREDNPYFIKLLDFGIAQLRGDGSVQGLTVAGQVMGTPQYMSPEQITGATVDVRTDVWALGVMLYKAATGKAPFKGESFSELADGILHHPPAKPSLAAPDATIAPALDALVMDCLERDLDKRCGSIEAFIAGLAKVAAAYKLDDKAILAAVRGDAGAISEPLPLMRSEPTRASLAGSMPLYQGAGEASLAGGKRSSGGSKTGVYLAAAIATLALAGGGYALFGRGTATDTAAPAVAPAAPVATTVLTIKQQFAAGDHAGVQKLAEAGLHDALASGDAAQQAQAVDAIAGSSAPAGAPLLYLALKGSPEIRVKAAHALGELALPDGAPKVRAALDDSGDKVRVELAATLYALGDKDSLAILKRAVSDPGLRLTAAVALANAGDDKDAHAVLADIMEGTPEGREQWRRAAAGLWKLGDVKAKRALDAELAQPDALRAVSAATLLARGGDADARAYLVRVAADKDFARRGEASAALAQLGEASALDWATDGLHSTDVEERKLAIAACARLAKHGGDRLASGVAGLATDDPDRGVRLAADAALLAL